MWSEIENKGKSKEKIRFGKGLPKWLSHRSTEVYRNSDPAEVPNRTEDFGRPLPTFTYGLLKNEPTTKSSIRNYVDDIQTTAQITSTERPKLKSRYA